MTSFVAFELLMDAETDDFDSGDRGSGFEFTKKTDNSAHRTYNQETCQVMFAGGLSSSMGIRV